MSLIETFKKFMADDSAFDMFIVGPAGTGKTTSLKELVQYCLEERITAISLAYTHKACTILRQKLPELADVRTLHKFLRKRPGINTNATKVKQIAITVQFGEPEVCRVIFVDEFSMVGESDATSIGELQDPEYTGICRTKVVYIGDVNQLPPVKGTFTLTPAGKYVHRLTKVHRQAEDNKLIDTLSSLNDMINTGKTKKLAEHATFKRNKDIVTEYLKSNANNDDKILLAYTNKEVENLNKQVVSIIGDNKSRWVGQLRKVFTFKQNIDKDKIFYIDTVTEPIPLDSKYKTLEFLLELDYLNFGLFEDEEGDSYVFAYVFGHYQYKLKNEELSVQASNSNADIEDKYKEKASTWAYNNPHEPETRHRARCWREFLSFSECVMLVDHPYALTVHKSQGSTYRDVFISNSDLRLNPNAIDYLKLLYVGISRASQIVYMDS